MKKIRKIIRLFVLIMLVLSFLPLQIGKVESVKTSKADAINLLNDGSFNDDVSQNWYMWKTETSAREFTLGRGYLAPFGFGPYSLAVTASGGLSEGLYEAGIVSIENNKFEVIEGNNYIISLYTRSTSPAKIALHLENATSYETVSDVKEVEVGTRWSKTQTYFTPTASGEVSLVIAIGDIADEGTLYLDGLNLFENTVSVKTTKISGYIGDTGRKIYLNNGNLFSQEEIEVELPYVDDQTGVVGVKRFSPVKVQNSVVVIDMPEQTFSGIGRVYAAGNMIGEFNYQVGIKINEFSPNPIRVDEDLVIYGNGFMPVKENNFVIMKVTDALGNVSEKWVTPHIVDYKLNQIVVKVPAGIVNDRVLVRNYHNTLEGGAIEINSNALRYNLKPTIYNLDWAQAGYEQIGDKVAITGKGIAKRSRVNFYDVEGNYISSASGTLTEVNEEGGYEVIEVTTPKELNKLQATVKIGSFESDKADALSYSARPILKSVRGRSSRTLPVSNAKVAAAKPGDTIKLYGQGFKDATDIRVEFPILDDLTIEVAVPLENINKYGGSIDVVVPKEAQSGQIRVIVNEKASNQVPLEIIPHIVSVTPLVPWPGEEMTFWTNGVGLDIEEATVHFQLNTRETVQVKPLSLEESGHGDVVVTVIAPSAISNSSSGIKLQYGHWTNEENYDIEVNPHIKRAAIDLDNKVLIINGHGFSNNLRDNEITYKYADGTVVTPNVKMMSITSTGEGQEIKIKILDDYYYGHVSVSVNEVVSNEANIGPAVITRIERRVQYVGAENRVMGVLYISGRNFGAEGDVKAGSYWADTHYRSDTFIIAVLEANEINNNPVIITKSE